MILLVDYAMLKPLIQVLNIGKLNCNPAVTP